MALISKDDRRRIDIPHEPGEWIELRAFTTKDSAEVEAGGGNGQINLGLQILARAITTWSYKDANGATIDPTEETIGQLDLDTFKWLMQEVDLTSGRRGDVEKKGLAVIPSPPSSRRAASASGRRR